MRYIIVSKTYKYYPFHLGGQTFTWMLENAKEYSSIEEANRQCEWLYQNLVSYPDDPHILKIVDKQVLLRKDKLKKLNATR
jgi:hypothetical protein